MPVFRLIFTSFLLLFMHFEDGVVAKKYQKAGVYRNKGTIEGTGINPSDPGQEGHGHKRSVDYSALQHPESKTSDTERVKRDVSSYSTIWSCTPQGNTMKCNFKRVNQHGGYKKNGNREDDDTEAALSRACPVDKPKEDLYRLGKSRFYVIQREKEAHGKNVIQYKGAGPACKKHGLQLATLPDLPTNTMVSQLLEDFMRDKPYWNNTHWWIDAVFNKDMEQYLWSNDKNKPLKFHNFYKHPPRPDGFGNLVDKKNGWLKADQDPFCITIAMLRGRDGEYPGLGVFTAWWERLCSEPYHTSVLCETKEPSCDFRRPFPENNYNDHYDGMWPMSNRRFVVSYLPKSKKNAEALCKKYNLQIYTPTSNDEKCIVPLLKEFVPFKLYHFWTSLSYNMQGEKFRYLNGTAVKDELLNMTRDYNKDGGRNIKNDRKSCVSMYWDFETPWENKDLCNCWADALELDGENCLDHIGVICQHPDFASRKCQKTNPNGMDKFVKFNEKSEEYLRSTYRVPVGKGNCPVGYRLARRGDPYWGSIDDFTGTDYLYDFDAEYNIEREGDDCLISKVKTGGNQLSQDVKTVNCKGTHPKQAFFICRQSD